MGRNCCCRKSCIEICRQDCYKACAAACMSSTCTTCSSSTCSKKGINRCYPRFCSCSLCKKKRHDEKKQRKKAKCEDEKKENSGETIICKRVCMPRRNWNIKQVAAPKVSYKDILHQVPNDMFEMDHCGFKNVYRRGKVFNVGKANVEGKRDSFIVLKWVRSNHSCHRDHYSAVIEEAKDCAKVVEKFLNEVDTGGWKVKVLIPKKVKRSCSNHSSGHIAVAEPLLDDYYTFYKSAKDLRRMGSHTSDKILQALLHFSINDSEQQRMMTNLEGYVSERRKTIFLSGPVMRNRGDRSSHGKEADISEFLRKHHCSSMCSGFKEADEEVKCGKRKRFRFKAV